MRTIELLSVPNQSLTIAVGEALWELHIKVALNTMFADVRRDGQGLVLGQRLVADAPIIPYRYLSHFGNFAILTRDDELPWWEEFGRSQSLVFLEASEVGIDD